jgi:hypothetical protein
MEYRSCSFGTKSQQAQQQQQQQQQQQHTNGASSSSITSCSTGVNISSVAGTVDQRAATAPAQQVVQKLFMDFATWHVPASVNSAAAYAALDVLPPF